jgi:hypothetical protein
MELPNLSSKYEFLVGSLTGHQSAEFLAKLQAQDRADLFAHLGAAHERAATVHNKDDDKRRGENPNEAVVRVDRAADIVDPDEGYRAPDFKPLRELGERIFWRWFDALHKFTCASDPENSDLRGKVLATIGAANVGTATAFIAVVLRTQFKEMSPGEAALIAALTVQLLGRPALDEICVTWSNALAGHRGPK